MAKPAKHRQALIMAAARLFRRRGYAGASTGDILKLSGAPRGSLYHYFPGGKEEIGAAAVAAAGALVTRTLSQLAENASNPAHFIDLYTTELISWMRHSNYEDGCPISTTLLETGASSEKIAEAGRAAFHGWRAVIGALLEKHGATKERAAARASLIISAIEGALIVSKTEQSPHAIEVAAAELKALLTE
ncbi:MAG: TetR/AcrR family transcriptional regulator [Pseudomonadota bacterium]